MYLKKRELKRLVSNIQDLESKTNCELRIHIDKRLNTSNSLYEAKRVFKKYKMYETKERNGILLYIAIRINQIAIFEDIGLSKILSEDFLRQSIDKVMPKFKAGKYCNAIEEIIEIIAPKVIQAYPKTSENQNELSNEISFT
ncbi:MAG: TPM domain-containing protein [Chitinophagales bacterium]|jgi:uncharacterized membrane protein|nr:TPM domain-containing protein [Chitinophagales bacterium]